MKDAGGKMKVRVLTLEDGDILGPALRATLKWKRRRRRKRGEGTLK